jgi:tyrosinase
VPDSEAAGHRLFAILDRNPHEADVSYQMDVYLYPRQAPFDPASRPFRDRYLAGTGVHWGTGSPHHQEEPPPMALEISRPVRDLAQNGSGGEVWNVSLAVSVLPSLTTFGEPSVQDVAP